MIGKINDFLAGWAMTIVGGVFLIAFQYYCENDQRRDYAFYVH